MGFISVVAKLIISFFLFGLNGIMEVRCMLLFSSSNLQEAIQKH